MLHDSPGAGPTASASFILGCCAEAPTTCTDQSPHTPTPTTLCYINKLMFLCLRLKSHSAQLLMSHRGHARRWAPPPSWREAPAHEIPAPSSCAARQAAAPALHHRAVVLRGAGGRDWPRPACIPWLHVQLGACRWRPAGGRRSFVSARLASSRIPTVDQRSGCWTWSVSVAATDLPGWTWKARTRQ